MNFHFLNGRNNTANIQQGTLLTCVYCNQNESQKKNPETRESTTKFTQNMPTNLSKSCTQTLHQWWGKGKKKQRKEESNRELLETFTSCSAAYLCLRQIHGLSPAELLYSKAVSQPKHQLGKPFHPASPQPASDNIKIHEKKTLKSLPHRRDFRGNREHSTLVFTGRKSPTPS